MIHRLIILFTISVLCTSTFAQTCSEFVESTTCGGNVVGDSGIIRYTHSDYKSERSGCFWLIRSGINSKIEVRLLQDTFSSSQHIEIYRLFLSGEIGGHTNWTIRAGDIAPRQIDGPVILIKFSSFGSRNDSSPGFTLLYRGCGPSITNPPSFSHFYRERIPGEREIVRYPENGGLYLPNQLVTYLGLRKDRAIAFNSEPEWKIKLTYQDIEPSNACLFADSLVFYNGGFNNLAGVNEKNEFIWRFCERNNNKTSIVPQKSPKYGNTFPDYIGILAVFSSDRSVNGKGFIFEW